MSSQPAAQVGAIAGGTKKLGAEGCGADHFLKFMARQWMSHIVWALARGKTMRFGALRRALPGAVSARVLSNRLKQLESHGLVSRHDAGKMPLHVEYKLTADGLSLDAALRGNETLAGHLEISNGNKP